MGFVVVFGLAAGIACRIPDWHRFPLPYTLVAIANLVVGSVLSGLVLASFVPGIPGAP